MASAYCRAIFSALSTASEPPETKNTRFMPAGHSAAVRAASASAASVSKCSR